VDRTATTFAEFYQGAYERFDQTHRVAGSIPLDLIRCAQDSHETPAPSGDVFVIGTAIASDIRHAWVDVGDGRCPLVDLPGILTLWCRSVWCGSRPRKRPAESGTSPAGTA